MSCSCCAHNHEVTQSHDEHKHHHENNHNKSGLIKIIISTVFLLFAFLLNHFFQLNFYLKLASFLLPYLIIGFSVIKEAVENIFHKEFFDENFLMTVATVVAFVIGEYPEAVLVMLLSQIGEFFEEMASEKARKSISEMMDIKPDFANLLENETIKKVNPEIVKIGETIVVKPGEKIPLDGIVEKGESSVNTAALTGESLPRTVEKGTEVISGSINLSGLLYIKVTKTFSESTISKILELVENAENKKAKAENFITKFAKIYTPAVVFAAIAIGIIPSVIFGSWSTWVHRACVFLVISCPCALVISVPLSFFAGIGAASKQGILIKGGNYIESLSKIKIAIFDKTGTLTKGNFSVAKVFAKNNNQKEILELASMAESFSNHPIAKAITKATKTENYKHISGKEIPGFGVEATFININDENSITNKVFCGNQKYMKSLNIDFEPATDFGTIVYIAKNQEYLGFLVISDEVKPEAASALADLRNLGIEKNIMLTGDHKSVAQNIGKQLGIEEIYSELLPQDKVSILENILKEKKLLCFVGDGINDAPVLTRADVGIAMGGLGSDAAIEASDVVLMEDNPKKIAVAVKIARNTLKIVKENISFALGVKLLVLLAGVFGLAPMWLAIFADVGVSVLAILNAMRAGKL